MKVANMQRSFVMNKIVLALAFMVTANLATGAQAQSCNRGCLLTVLDSFLEALVAQDPVRRQLQRNTVPPKMR